MDNNYLKIYLEDGKTKIKGTVNLGYIGSFKDTQIEIIDSLRCICCFGRRTCLLGLA